MVPGQDRDRSRHDRLAEQAVHVGEGVRLGVEDRRVEYPERVGEEGPQVPVQDEGLHQGVGKRYDGRNREPQLAGQRPRQEHRGRQAGGDAQEGEGAARGDHARASAHD